MVYGKWHLQPNRVVRGQKREKKGEHWRKIKSIWNFEDPLQNPNSIIMQLQFIFLSSSRPISQLWIFCQIIQDPHWCFSILRQASFICAHNSAACSWTVASSWSIFSLSSVKMSYGEWEISAGYRISLIQVSAFFLLLRFSLFSFLILPTKVFVFVLSNTKTRLIADCSSK